MDRVIKPKCVEWLDDKCLRWEVADDGTPVVNVTDCDPKVIDAIRKFGDTLTEKGLRIRRTPKLPKK